VDVSRSVVKVERSAGEALSAGLGNVPDAVGVLCRSADRSLAGSREIHAA
jgi:hypothetical protein